MYSRLARTSLGALVALLSLCTLAGTAFADAKSAPKCSSAIIKAGGAFIQGEAKILQKCREAVLKGKTCDAAKTQASIDKARKKLNDTIVKACSGKDKSCNLPEDADGTQPTLTEIGWNIGTCPNFEGGTCTNAITDCDDIPTCIQCIGEASVNQAIDLYYPTGRPASTGDKFLNKCQATIGKAAVTFFAAKSKALSKCWGTKVKKPANCPADAQSAISTAKNKFITALAKPCLGVNNSTIGLPNNCPAVTPEGLATCSGGVSSLADVGNCVACVTEFKVDCPDRVSALSAGATYPAECLVAVPTPNATATATPTPTPTATPVAVVCGDGIAAPSEPCDASASAATWAQCGPTFACNNCNCACPTKVAFTGDALAPESILDTGWTGISHRAPIISDGTATIALTCPGGGTSRPCGTCTVSGPIANGPGQLQNQRCTNDTSIRCTTDTPCTAGGGTCQFFFGSDLPLAAGGVTVCAVNQFNGPVSGTANVETGDAVTVANLTARVYTGIAIDSPCARCIGDTTINDGVLGGTCSGGDRDGQPCDGNGTIANRPDFGTTSLDCPLNAAVLIAALPIDLSNATGPVTKTVDANSPNCTATAGEKCLCDTCNNLAATPCDSNADCVAVGATQCGGKRCLGGTNAGAPCTNTTACPGAGICGRPGAATAPSACLDDADTVGILDCVDGGNGEGTCTQGPIDQNCSVASGHGQRGCTGDVDCGGGVGSCLSVNRNCFLTGGFSGKNGTGTLVAVGAADAPMADTSNPTLGAVFCVGPTGSSSINGVSGLPGPGRATIKGQAQGLP